MKTLFLIYFENLYIHILWFKILLFLELLSMGLLDLNTAEIQATIKAEESCYLIYSRGVAKYFCKHLRWRAL